MSRHIPLNINPLNSKVMNNKKKNAGPTDFSYYGLSLLEDVYKRQFSESAPTAATIISKVFFSIDTISIFMQLSVCLQR